MLAASKAVVVAKFRVSFVRQTRQVKSGAVLAPSTIVFNEGKANVLVRLRICLTKLEEVCKCFGIVRVHRLVWKERVVILQLKLLSFCVKNILFRFFSLLLNILFFLELAFYRLQEIDSLLLREVLYLIRLESNVQQLLDGAV